MGKALTVVKFAAHSRTGTEGSLRSHHVLVEGSVVAQATCCVTGSALDGQGLAIVVKHTMYAPVASTRRLVFVRADESGFTRAQAVRHWTSFL